MRIRILLLPLIIVFAGCANINQQQVLTYVDPFIGTDGHGHTFPGATVPFGMVQLSPDTRKDNWDACSGYHYSDTAILGFSHTHLSGTGVGDYGDIRFMPLSGELKIRPGIPGTSESGYSSRFSHKKETASPGYYQVYLTDPDVNAEFTTTKRCGFHKYSFTSAEDACVIIDLKEAVTTDIILDSYVRIINDHEISGFRRTSGWAQDQVIYFHAVFSCPFILSGIAKDGIITDGLQEATGKDLQAYARFNTKEDNKVLVKVGISAASIDGAKRNLDAEIPGWDFEQVLILAKSAWAEELGRVEINGGAKEDRIKFYTALYHSYMAPNLFSDIDGHYRGHDGQLHQGAGFDIYTVFSLWDTYRALHPLMTILQTGRTTDFINTFLDIQDKGGLLPVWELAGNETNCMIGYHAVPVIADAYLKGISGFDAEKALAAMMNSARQDQFGLKWYKALGYIPAESEGESISKTLEYAYDDWCIAMMAGKMNKKEEFSEFIQRAQFYKNIYDPDTRFLRGKRNGMFTQPFDPSEVNFMLTEANSWQYTFYVPQDISGLIRLMGGEKAFGEKLDKMFSASTGLSGRQQADISGLIGQYAHGNEPSHHMAYLYNYIGRPDKTQHLVRKIMDELYGVKPAGLCGNEDCGQMSAWFVLSAMGFYPVTPGSGYYSIGSPLFDEVNIHLENGKDFTIKADRNSVSDIYIQSALLNGENYAKSFLYHSVIMDGGTLEFKMSGTPEGEWGRAQQDWPVASVTDELITPVPFYEAVSQSFQDTLTVKIRHIDPDASIFYKSDDSPEKNFGIYKEPILTGQAMVLGAYATSGSMIPSKISDASFFKIHHEWKVKIAEPYSSQYTGGGDIGLIDGQRGGPNFRTGSWQGYNGVDFEAVIDMGKQIKVGKISASFLHDQRSWIFLPEMVEFLISDNDKEYKTVALIKPTIPDQLPEAAIEEFSKDGLSLKGRYIKVKGINRKICPEWHVGAGEKAWLFIDEISIE
jgi:predicted alpha-1,2-mannosidase